MIRSLFVSLLALLTIAVTPLLAQNNVLDLRYELSEDGGAKRYSNFIYVRNFGRIMFEAFHLRIPGGGGVPHYNEVSAGLGYNFTTLGDFAIYGIGHIGKGSDDWYFLPTVFAVDIEGKLTGSAFILRYEELGSTGIGQWLVDPFELKYNVSGPFHIGYSTYYWRPEGGPSVWKNGVLIDIADRYGDNMFLMRRVNYGGGWEFRFKRVLLL